MTDTNQKQLGNTLWNIADQLRGAMDADDFRDYMLSFLFLRYLSDNYETASRKEVGNDDPTLEALKIHKKGLMQGLFRKQKVRSLPGHRSSFLISHF